MREMYANTPLHRGEYMSSPIVVMTAFTYTFIDHPILAVARGVSKDLSSTVWSPSHQASPPKPLGKSAGKGGGRACQNDRGILLIK